MAAAWRQHHPNWVARVAFRWLLRLAQWRRRIDGWGKGREAQSTDARRGQAGC